MYLLVLTCTAENEIVVLLQYQQQLYVLTPYLSGRECRAEQHHQWRRVGSNLEQIKVGNK